MKFLTFTFVLGLTWWTSLWFTPDQAGERLFLTGEYEAAAQTFIDPMWQGAAWYRAGEFEKAATAFARLDTPEAHFNRGNSLIFLGRYEEAVSQFDQALALRPGWKAAQTNRSIAESRKKLVSEEGGEMGQQEIGADEIRFDKDQPGGEKTTVQQEEASSDTTMQAHWLRKVQTEPSQFLKAKFQYQLQESIE